MQESMQNTAPSAPRDGETEAPSSPAPQDPPRAPSPPARRALAEAAERRAAAEAARESVPTERQGRGGLDPVRYRDWEVKGLAVDF